GPRPELAPGLVDGLLGSDPDPRARGIVIRAMADVPTATSRAALACLVAFDRREALPCIAVPTLLVAGAEDTTAPPAMMERMASRIPGSRFAVIPGAGHLANLERPAAVNALVAEHLAHARKR